MNRTSLICLAFLALLVAAFAAMVVDGLRGRPAPQLDLLSRVCTLPGPSFATTYLETDRRAYADYSDVVHPGLAPVNQLDLIYVPR